MNFVNPTISDAILILLEPLDLVLMKPASLDVLFPSSASERNFSLQKNPNSVQFTDVFLN